MIKVQIKCDPNGTMTKLPIDQIHEFQGNLKSLSESDYNKLKEEIIATGFAFPFHVWLDPETGKHMILGGHQRKRVLSTLKAEGADVPPLPVIMVEAASKAEAKRRILQDASQFGKIEKQGLYEFSIENDMNLDFLQDSFTLPMGNLDWDSFNEEFFRDNTIAPVETEEVPQPPKKPTTVEGDLWILGDHRLLCGDSTQIEEVERLMNFRLADMVFTDPPYNTGMTEKKNNGSTRLSHMFNDSYTDEEWQLFMQAFIANYFLIMKDNSVAYICLDWRRNHELVPHIKNSFKLSNIIVWDKMVHGLGSDYKYTYELINVCKKGSPVIDSHQGSDREYSDVWHIQRKMGHDDEHATKKPIEIIERAIKHATKEGQLVVDLFGGSGSTLVASIQTKRLCYIMEMDPKYCDVIIKRFVTMTGEDAYRVDEDGTKIFWKDSF